MEIEDSTVINSQIKCKITNLWYSFSRFLIKLNEITHMNRLDLYEVPYFLEIAKQFRTNYFKHIFRLKCIMHCYSVWTWNIKHWRMSNIPRCMAVRSISHTKPVVSRLLWKPFNRTGNQFFLPSGISAVTCLKKSRQTPICSQKK